MTSPAQGDLYADREGHVFRIVDEVNPDDSSNRYWYALEEGSHRRATIHEDRIASGDYVFVRQDSLASS